MTNNLKPFDLEAAKRGEPVVIKFGGHASKVIIIRFDLKHPVYKLLGIITTTDGLEVAGMFTEEGVWAGDFTKKTYLFMAAPSIPEGFMAYDPNVPPPENAEEIELFDTESQSVVKNITWFRSEWPEMRSYSSYRVAKWKGAKPSLEDTIQGLAKLFSTKPFGCALCHERNNDAIKLLNSLVEITMQRAVEKMKEGK